MAATESGHRWAANRRVRAALLVSGLRWRARSSLAMFAVAVFATGAAAFGPIYLHSADQLVLNGTLSGAAPGNTGLQMQLPAGPGQRSLAWLSRFARTTPEPGGKTKWWGSPILTEYAGFLTVPTEPSRPSTAAAVRPLTLRTTPTTPIHLVKIPKLPYRGGTPFVGSLVARTDVCAHLHIVAGTCPHGNGVVVSTRDAQTLGLSIGSTLWVVFRRTTHSVPLSVIGIYSPGNPSARYWWSQNYFGFGSIALGETSLTNIDAVFGTFGGVRALAPPTRINLLAQVPYVTRSLSVDAVGDLKSRLTAFDKQALRNDQVHVSTGLWLLLGEAASTEHAAVTVVDVVDLELVLLGILVLYFVASRTALEREPDVRLAELRGFRSRSTVAVALAEPVAIVATAVPIGLLGGWLVAGATAPAIFGNGVGVSVTLLSFVAAIAAGVVGIAAAGLGARRSLAGGLSAAADAPPGVIGRSRWSLLADAAVVAIAGAAFFELAVVGDSGSGPSGSNPLAAFAPGLLAVALGIVAARLLPRLLGATHRRTAFSTRIAASLATRTVARRREYRTQLVLGALAVALATFAVSGWVIAARNRDQRAELGVGAVKVLTVSVQPGTTFLHAVRAADPSGHDAMAVVVERAKDGTTLAVDSKRFASIAMWPADLGLPAQDVATRLVPKALPAPILVKGTAVSVTVDVSGDVLQPAPQLGMDVFDVDTQFSSRVTLGPLRPGDHRYSGSLTGDCPGGCHLTDLAVTWSPAASALKTASRSDLVTLEVRSVAQRAHHGPWISVRAAVGDLHEWTTDSGGARLFAAGKSLGARFALNGFGTVSFGPADVPTALPVLATPTSNSTASGDGGPLVVGLDGSTLSGHTVGSVASLPGVGTDAVLADLATTERYLSGAFTSDTPEVWLSKTAPSSIVARLKTHGVHVVSTATETGAVKRLSHSGLNLAYLLYLVAAAAAAILVVAATAFTLSSAARRRQGELAALRAVGVDARSLRRAVRVEQALVLGTGVVVGVVAGAISAAVALRSVPEFVVRTPGPPLELGLPVLDLVVVIAAIVAALAVTIVIGSSVVVRGATVDNLAGGQS